MKIMCAGHIVSILSRNNDCLYNCCRFAAMILFIVLPLMSFSSGERFKAVDKHVVVLQRELAKVHDTQRLPILRQIAELSWNTSQEEMWTRRLYNESMKRDSLSLASTALANLSYYYYNKKMSRQLKWCSRSADTIAGKMNRYEDSYFLVMYYDYLRDVWDGHYPLAFQNAKRFYQKAESCHNKKGIVLFDEFMGMLYLIMERYSQSEQYLNKAFETNERFFPNDSPGNIQFLSTLIEAQFELKPLSKVFRSLKKLDQLLTDEEHGKFGKNKGYTLERNRRILCSYYMSYYNRMGNYDMTAQYMKKAAQYKVNDFYVDFLINIESSKYYKEKKNYPLALQKINQVLAVDDTSTVDYLKAKADILDLMGRKDDAIKEYTLCFTMQKDKRRNAFDKEVAGLQNMYTNLQLQLNLKQAEMEREKLHRHTLTIALTFLIFAFVGMTVFAFYRGRVSRQLKMDKDELARAGDSLKKALKKADEINLLKDNFMHNISHEIRTPLNSIVGYSSIIAAETAHNENFSTYSKIIQDNTDALLTIVNNMVDLAVYQTSDFSTFQKENVDLTALCTESINFLALSGKLKDTVKVNLKGIPEEYVLLTSSKYLKSILNHLLINAAKYTTEGEINIEYKVEPEFRRVSFSVADTGIGIKPDCYESIFDSFEKGGSFVQGMGLGLTICRELIDKLGGEIHVDRQYTGGARFVFTHPLSL